MGEEYSEGSSDGVGMDSTEEPTTKVYFETILDRRLDRMVEIADYLGLSLDDVVSAIGVEDNKIFLEVSESPSSLPRYMASKVKP
ncbi:hypothetical protein [uncultured Pelagimonas sp.]|uniref:hypothetical protein n=1 Tax=uncultured Pelagimonas sp. TaxID=1618102 RepID=UPI002638A5D5|nr:hypothetical protein [uncultured Pelagimonas sp.]